MLGQRQGRDSCWSDYQRDDQFDCQFDCQRVCRRMRLQDKAAGRVMTWVEMAASAVGRSFDYTRMSGNFTTESCGSIA